jgi:uncharacterized protein (DUF488 family)
MATIYTIGHSNHEFKAFLALLRGQGISLLVDVRSSPYSRYVPQANRETLARALARANISYRWMGDRLGGKPDGVVADMVADYDDLRASSSFQQAITDLITLAAGHQTAIMCSEGDHRRCHRYKLISPVLLDQGINVIHIQPDGSLIDEDKTPKQLSLF